MEQLKGIVYLRSKLTQKRRRVLTRYDYYEMKNIVRDMGISTPPELRFFFDALGWCGKAVDSVADRLSVRGFSGNDLFNMQNIFDMNNSDILYDSAFISALIGSCSFIYVSLDENNFPRLQVIDGSNATGIIDTITGLLKEGYAVLSRDADTDSPTLEAYFEPRKTTLYYADGTIEEFANGVDYPLLVPIINRPDARRQFGHSRISRACMDLQNSAIRTIKRSEISAEFYSFPQKYITGLSEDAEGFDKWKATMSSLLTLTSDENGNHPIVGQFQMQSQTPHLEQLRLFASLFGGETGLTLDDLGFASGNPSSSDAIKSAHENLRLYARKSQAYFGTGLINVGMVAACLRDNKTYEREKVYQTKVAWNPVFEPDASSLSGIGDAMIKLSQTFPDYITTEKLKELTGI